MLTSASTVRTTTATLAALALVLGGLAALGWWGRADAPAASADMRPAWTEMEWPFPIDQWGRGKAFRCPRERCGSELTVYVRAKIGFCNCATGVSDDEELERISDFDLIGGRTAARAPGRPITVAWMKGRSRLYAVGPGSGPSALSVGFNDHCDAVVATAVIGRADPDKAEPAVLDLLQSPPVLRWAEVTLGL